MPIQDMLISDAFACGISESIGATASALIVANMAINANLVEFITLIDTSHQSKVYV
jgi:hypothetical protein